MATVGVKGLMFRISGRLKVA